MPIGAAIWGSTIDRRLRATGGRSLSLVEAPDLILLWIERARQRSQLASTDRSLLQDLGLSQADLDAERRKHFW